jgi:hypothetical protein
MSAQRRAGPSVTLLVVWAVWGAFSAAALLAARSGPNIPVGQDWRMVSAVTGHEPEAVHWLWHQDGNDRHPAGRAITVAVISAARDFRAASVLAVLGLVALSGLLIRASRRARGGVRLADIFFPAILLQPATRDLAPSVLLMSVIPLALGGIILLAVLSDPTLRTRRWSLLTALSMVTLPLTGLAGILVAAAAAPWMAACGWRHWPPREQGVPTDAGPALLSFIFVAIVVTGMVFSDYDFSGWSDPALDRGRLVLRTGSALAGALGPLAAGRWELVAGILTGLVAATCMVLVVAGHRAHDAERYRTLGLACMLAAGWLAVMMSAWGFAALLLCVVFHVRERYGRPVASVAVQAGLLVAGLAVVPANLEAMRRQRAEVSSAALALARDVAAGLPRDSIAARYQPLLMPGGGAADLAGGIALVSDARIGLLGQLPAGSSGR